MLQSLMKLSARRSVFAKLTTSFVFSAAASIVSIISIMLALPSQVFAQCAPLYTFSGQTGDWLGREISSAGDVNNDGYTDVIVGAYKNAFAGPSSGQAYVISGADGSTLYTKSGTYTNAQFGRSVGSAGDVNSDGHDDFLVGEFSGNTGMVYLYSGIDGSLIFQISGSTGVGKLGKAVAGVGDVNNDGTPDIAAYLAATMVRIYSGVDGAIIHSFNSEANNTEFGTAVDGAGDVNNDGFADIIIGANMSSPGVEGLGKAFVYSGIDGSLLYSYQGTQFLERLGFAVAGFGDINGDGYDDFGVSSLSWAKVRVFSGVDGSEMHSILGGYANFGWSIDAAGDIDADGFTDILIGSPWQALNGGTSFGKVYIHSGATGEQLHSYYGEMVNGQFGSSVAGIGDIDGDGVPDFAASAYTMDSNGEDAGQLYMTTVKEKECCCQSRGDYDHSQGAITIGDVTAGIGRIFAGGIEAACPEEADTNADGKFTIVDITQLIQHIFASGAGISACSSSY